MKGPAAVIAFDEAAQLQGTAPPHLDHEGVRLAGSARRERVVRSGAWSIAGYVLTQLVRTCSTLILARYFLGPEAFGLAGLMAVFLAGLSMLSELGLVTNIVQHPHGEQTRFLSTAFSIQVSRGVAIWSVASLAAYPLARFYGQPQLTALVLVGATAELIRGFTSAASWILVRQMDLRKITLLTLIAELVGFAAALGWALVSPSVWVIVMRSVVTAAAYALGSYFVCHRRVSFGWDPDVARQIVHFGGWVSFATAAHFLGGQSERLILGKFVTPAELGCFSLALMITAIPSGGIGQLMNQTFLPLISSDARQSRADTLRNFLVARRVFFGLSIFTAAGSLVVAKPLVNVLLSAKYEMAGWMLQILGLRVALDLFAAPASTLVLAYGRSSYSAGANTTRLVLMVAGVWFAFQRFGMRGAIVSLVIAQALSYFPLMAGAVRLFPESKRVELGGYAICLIALVASLAFVLS